MELIFVAIYFTRCTYCFNQKIASNMPCSSYLKWKSAQHNFLYILVNMLSPQYSNLFTHNFSHALYTQYSSSFYLLITRHWRNWAFCACCHYNKNKNSKFIHICLCPSICIFKSLHTFYILIFIYVLHTYISRTTIKTKVYL